MRANNNTNVPKGQSYSVNSAVKYKNSAMNTLHNLKLTSSHLKSEFEKILNPTKNFKPTTETQIKVAKIQLNRTSENNQVLIDGYDRKNMNELKHLHSYCNFYYII